MEQTPEKEAALSRKEQKRYAGLLRIAHAAYLKMPYSFYSTIFKGVWTPPKAGEFFDPGHEYVINNKLDEALPNEEAEQVKIKSNKIRQSHHPLGRKG